LLARLALIFIDIYTKITSNYSKNCRYYPTCSVYAHDSIEKYGIGGIFAAFMRILRCNQFFKGGFDPVK